MIRMKHFFNNKIMILVILIVLIATVAVALGYKKARNTIIAPAVTELAARDASINAKGRLAGSPGRKDPAVMSEGLSKVILNVSNMSCSGCISTIKASVEGFQGIKETLVEISSGKVEIYFDSDRLKDISLVAKAITDSGYPASVLKTLSADEVKKERDFAEAKSKYYVVSVGGWDVARSDFEAELETAKRRYSKIYGKDLFNKPQGKTLLENLKAQIISKLIDEGIMMQEIVKADFKIEKETTDRQVNAYLKSRGKTLDEFKDSLKETGYDFEYFRKKFEIKILINQYINQKILADASSDFEKQKMFNSWFNNSKVMAEVVYYDRNLESLVQKRSASGGCGVSN